MMISTRGRYALRVMVDLAEQQDDSYTPLKEIAKRQEISEKYLEAILPALIKHNYLTGHRGKGGGYKLTYAPEAYKVGNILKLVEGNIATVACLEPDSGDCSRAGSCRTLPMWEQLNSLIDNFFEQITLADLCKQTQQSGGAI